MIPPIGAEVKPLQIEVRGTPVHMIRLTEAREIAPYKGVHPSEER